MSYPFIHKLLASALIKSVVILEPHNTSRYSLGSLGNSGCFSGIEKVSSAMSSDGTLLGLFTTVIISKIPGSVSILQQTSLPFEFGYALDLLYSCLTHFVLGC